jgi:hypothetical protein
VRVPPEDARRPKEAVKVERRSLDCHRGCERVLEAVRVYTGREKELVEVVNGLVKALR